MLCLPGVTKQHIYRYIQSSSALAIATIPAPFATKFGSPIIINYFVPTFSYANMEGDATSSGLDCENFSQETTGNQNHKQANHSVLRTKLFSFLVFVKPDKLSDAEKLIHEKHVEALHHGKEMYTDPSTGYHVLSRLAHLTRGTCCGNACRHCPFNHENVPTEKRTKSFNSAFFV